MRSLARHLFTLGSAVSLLLCVGVCVLWARSYWYYEHVEYTRTPNGALIQGYCGYWRLGVTREFPFPRYGFTRRHARLDGSERGRTVFKDDTDRPYAPFGFGRSRWASDDTGRSYHTWWMVVAPCWSVAVVLLVLPGLWVIRHRRERRAVAIGLCHTCGYDLRASSDRCPECGTEVKALAAR